LTENEAKIIEELKVVQGKAVDIGGYFMPDTAKLNAIMRPSATFNAALASAA
jgi:isocitrate dehydrogenase